MYGHQAIGLQDHILDSGAEMPPIGRTLMAAFAFKVGAEPLNVHNTLEDSFALTGHSLYDLGPSFWLLMWRKHRSRALNAATPTRVPKGATMGSFGT